MNKLKIALIGYGRMGRMIHSVANKRGHHIVACIDGDQDPRWQELRRETVDVAIEFSLPEVAERNVRRLLGLGIPVISGTTGWSEGLDLLYKELQQSEEASLLWASNFSIGVNLFFAINRKVAQIMAKVPSYQAELEEIHHIHKLDAPSGTAITLAKGLIASMPERLSSWQLCNKEQQTKQGQLPIVALRQGEVAGVHSVRYRSPYDSIELKHEAFSRESFAQGAVTAAEFIVQHPGLRTMDDLLNHFLNPTASK